MERIDIHKKTLNRFAFDEFVIFCSQVLIFFLVTLFTSNFLSSKEQLIAHMGQKINDNTLSDIGYTFLAIFIVIGLFSIIGNSTSNKAVSRYVKEIIGEIPRVIYFFGSSVVGIMLVVSIYVANNPEANEIAPEKFVILSLIMGVLTFLVGLLVSLTVKYKSHII